MSVKSWVLDRVQGIAAAGGRADLPARGGSTRLEPVDDADAGLRSATVPVEPVLTGGDHLGAYAPLIAAVQDELQHFMASRARLHVVIAERDRFLLTAIGVRSAGGAECRDLLKRFMREFRPEQVKRYLAREVIGRLPNAAVIDLSQFAGLTDLGTLAAAEAADDYAELLAALRTTPETAPPRPYEIEVVGRWSEADTVSTITGLRTLHTQPTPLAGRRGEFTVDDGEGPRPVVLDAVVSGRRYTIGKDAGCDLRIAGTYTSRRHAEVWLDGEVWHVADAGSTNGIRIENSAGAASGAADEATALAPGARVVLSARAEGPTRDYPWLALRTQPAAKPTAAVPVTPVAAVPRRGAAVPTTVVHVRTTERAFEISHRHAGQAQTVSVGADSLPIAIGRSRDQSLVIGREFAGVSGRHVSIDEIGDGGVRGVVQGDNGVTLDAVLHVAGARFEWRPGQAMVLGGALVGEPACTLSLARAGGD